MDFTPREPTTEQVERYIGDGFWTGRTVGQVLAEALGEAADRPFTVRSDRRPYRGTLGEVDALARRVASGLRSRGIGAGDVVSFQLPNWVEAAATFYACTYVGAVVVPIVHFYGPKEVGYILRKTRVRALITADRFGHQDFLANLDGLCDDLPEDTVLLGLADSGAHVSQLCDACFATDLLGNWVRDREVMPLEKAIYKLSGEPAAVYGLDDRGTLEVGKAADVVAFDPETVAPGPLRRIRDFPADGERLVADRPEGMRHMLVNGTVIRADGTPDTAALAARPGKLLRS